MFRVGLRVQSELHQLECANEAMNMEEGHCEVNNNNEEDPMSYLDHEDDAKVESEKELSSDQKNKGNGVGSFILIYKYYVEFVLNKDK